MCSLVVESVLCSADVTSLRSWAILERKGMVLYLLISLCFLHLVMFLLTVYDYLVQK